MSADRKSGRITERVTAAGAKLVDYVNRLVKEGNVWRLVISKPDGDVFLEVPLMVGIAVSGILTLTVPVLAALAAIAALVAKVQVDIVRSGGED